MTTPIKLVVAVTIFGLCGKFRVFAKEQIFLGPPNSGAARNGAQWLTGANGTGFTAIDFNDSPSSGFDLTLGNAVAGNSNNADWRCPPFSLGAAAGGARPMTWSFAYKLTDAVAKGNNIHVQLRFFDSTGSNFLSEIVLPIGARTGDSKMTDYKTRTVENILAPQKAKTADIWIDANIFEPWVCGSARFGDFSVTARPRSFLFKMSVTLVVLVAVSLCASSLIYFRRRHTYSTDEK